MCVIFYQTKEQELFTYDEFKEAALTNPHGMGWMANIGGHVCYKKGYFNVNQFYDDYVELRRNPELVDIALHFRIGTGSAIDVANCHPFPITSNPKRIKKSKGICDVGVMMNGIIGKSTTEFSDTALYVMKNLKMYYDNDRRFFLNMSRQREIIFENEIYSCRFVFMSRDGSKLFGKGWSDYNGKAQVSNRHWIPKTKVKTAIESANVFQNTYSDWDDDGWYDDDDYYNSSYNAFNSWYSEYKARRFATSNATKRHKSYIDYIESELIGGD